MRRLTLCLAALCGALFTLLIFIVVPRFTEAQTQVLPPDYAIVVASCGTPPGGAYVAGTIAALTQDTTGVLCVNQ